MPVQVVAEDTSTEMVGSVYEGVQEKSICEVPTKSPPNHPPTPPSLQPISTTLRRGSSNLIVFVIVINKITGVTSMQSPAQMNLCASFKKCYSDILCSIPHCVLYSSTTSQNFILSPVPRQSYYCSLHFFLGLPDPFRPGGPNSITVLQGYSTTFLT